MSRRLEVLSLYKTILKNAKVFPSIKRVKLYEEIRTKFREDKNLTNEEEIKTSMSIGRDSLKQLSMYSNLRNTDGNWKVELSQNPLPCPSPKD